MISLIKGVVRRSRVLYTLTLSDEGFMCVTKDVPAGSPERT